MIPKDKRQGKETIVRFRIDYELLSRLDEYASEERQSRSGVIRGLIVELLKREGGLRKEVPHPDV